MGLQDRIFEMKVRLLEGALDASAARNPRMQGNRHAATSAEEGETGDTTNDPGSLELTSILAGRPGRVIYRFRCEHPGTKPRILCARSISGSIIEAQIRRLSNVNAKDGRCSYIMSVEMSSEVTRFIADMPGIPPLPVKPAEIKQLSFDRDMLMVSPANDGLYEEWLERNRTKDAVPGSFSGEKLREKLPTLPKMSIVTPLFNTPPDFLRDMVESVTAQAYPNWEHVLVNASPQNEELRSQLAELADPRFKVVDIKENLGIPGNTLVGIEAATGDFVSFLDHDDILEPDALECFVCAIAENPDADLLYCDEDAMSEDGTCFFEALLKTNFNLDLLLSYNFVIHMLTVSRRVLETVRPYTSESNGAQDWDLTLKAASVMRSCVHVPRVLYHWREHAGSVNGGSKEAKPYVVDSSIHILKDYFAGRGIEVGIEPLDIGLVFKTIYPESRSRDVSLVVSYESLSGLARMLSTLDGQRCSSILEVVAVGPAPTACDIEKAGLAEVDGIGYADVLSELAGAPIVWKAAEAPSSYAKACAAGAQRAKGAYLMLASDRVAFDATSDAIGLMRDMFCRDEVGIVSAKAMSLDGLNLHAGLCVKENGSIGYLNQGFIDGMGGGYHGCAECCCDYSAIDGSCFMMRAADYTETGGLQPSYAGSLAAFVDLSFAVRDAGRLVVVNPFAKVSMLAEEGALELGASHILGGTFDYETLWGRWGASYRRDVLANPNVKLSNSYFNLDV